MCFWRPFLHSRRVSGQGFSIQLEEYRMHVRSAERLESRLALLEEDLSTAEATRLASAQQLESAPQTPEGEELRKALAQTLHELDTRIAGIRGSSVGGGEDAAPDRKGRGGGSAEEAAAGGLNVTVISSARAASRRLSTGPS